MVSGNLTGYSAPIGKGTEAPLEEDPSKEDDFTAPIDEGTPSPRKAAQ